MDIQGWIASIVVCSAVCGGVLHFSAGGISEKAIRLLCGLILCAAVVLPVGSAFQNFSNNYQTLLIIPDYGNRIESQEAALSDELILKTAEQRLAALAWDELARRLKREDFSVEINRAGKATLTVTGEDFPAEEARLVLSALLGGCEVEMKGENNIS